MHPMTKVVQWNSKEFKGRQEEIWLLMNRNQPSCICLQEVILENDKYNLERLYKFYATTPPGRRSKGGTAVAIKKDITQKRLNIRKTIQVVSLEVYLIGKGKRTVYFIYLLSTEEDMRELLGQILTDTIHYGEVNKAQKGE